MTHVGRVHVTATVTRWLRLNVDVADRSTAPRQKPSSYLAHVRSLQYLYTYLAAATVTLKLLVNIGNAVL